MCAVFRPESAIKQETGAHFADTKIAEGCSRRGSIMVALIARLIAGCSGGNGLRALWITRRCNALIEVYQARAGTPIFLSIIMDEAEGQRGRELCLSFCAHFPQMYLLTTSSPR